jgi:hypothetical protein
VLFAYVDQNGTVAVLLELMHVGRVDLVDLLLDLADEFSARCHYFRKDSEVARRRREAQKRSRGALSDAPAKTQT